MLRQQRLEARAAEIVLEVGERIQPKPIVEVGTVDWATAAFREVQAARQAARDSLVRADNLKADSLILAARLATLNWDKVEPDAQGFFLERFGETYWQAVGARGLLTDTLDTHALRGKLQAEFGRPTRNGDAQRRYGYGGSEYIQFEYWFVVNDSIPLLALDIDGPFGRGLLVASDEEYQDILPDLKADLSARIEAQRPDPWLDYYHSFERGRWFKTGFNGTEDYTLPVRPPRWSGREGSDRWVIHR
ncbi:MAG: hypothetical protein WBA11_08660 [Rubrivirga sp.]